MHLRQHFPFFEKNPQCVYFDTAATAQKPTVVLQAMQNFYETANANVHRGVHGLSERATASYEHAREAVQKFLNAKAREEIVFTSGATAGITLFAQSWGRAHLQKDDVIVLSLLEHHSNIVPWLMLKNEIGIHIEWIDIDDEGNLNLAHFDELLKKPNVKLVSITGLSNVLGIQTDLKTIAQKTHDAGALLFVDAAQLLAHENMNVQALDIDALTFSGHKLYGPTGIGALYVREELLRRMTPTMGGGGTISEVTTEGFTWTDIPARFEAGTPPIAEAVGLHAALDWLQSVPPKGKQDHEQNLLTKARTALQQIEGIHILGPKHPKGCFSFTLDHIHPHDLTDVLGQQDIHLRAGHHCAQPLHHRLGIPASTRLSIGLYNTEEDVEKAVKAIEQARILFVS